MARPTTAKAAAPIGAEGAGGDPGGEAAAGTTTARTVEATMAAERADPDGDGAVVGGQAGGGEHGLVAELGQEEGAGHAERGPAAPGPASSSSSAWRPRQVHTAKPRNSSPAPRRWPGRGAPG